MTITTAITITPETKDIIHRWITFIIAQNALEIKRAHGFSFYYLMHASRMLLLDTLQPAAQHHSPHLSRALIISRYATLMFQTAKETRDPEAQKKIFFESAIATLLTIKIIENSNIDHTLLQKTELYDNTGQATRLYNNAGQAAFRAGQYLLSEQCYLHSGNRNYSSRIKAIIREQQENHEQMRRLW